MALASPGSAFIAVRRIGRWFAALFGGLLRPFRRRPPRGGGHDHVYPLF